MVGPWVAVAVGTVVAVGTAVGVPVGSGVFVAVGTGVSIGEELLAAAGRLVAGGSTRDVGAGVWGLQALTINPRATIHIPKSDNRTLFVKVFCIATALH